MKLIFSTKFDDITHNNDSLLIKGTKGLLSLLESELGLYRSFPSNQVRLKNYLQSLSEYQGAAFYTDSLNKNKYQVAEKLLTYRDLLVSFGWNSELSNQPERLQVFSSIENIFQSKENNYIGEADRWNLVLEQLTAEKIAQLYIKEIQLLDKVEFLPPFLRKLFEKLDCIVTYPEVSEKSNIIQNNLSLFKNSIISSYKDSYVNQFIDLKTIAEDRSLVLLQFHTIQELNDAMAFWSDASEHLFLCRDNANFDFSLMSFQKTASGSNQNEAQPQIIQLFKLILPAITGSFNSNTFLSFLQLKYSPLPYQLKRKLLKCFVEYPGIGNEKWNDIIFEFVNNADLKVAKENQLIADIFLDFTKMDSQTSIKKAKSLLNYLSKWSMKMMSSFDTNSLLEQFMYLYQLCEETLDLIKEEQDLNNVIKAFNQTYRAKSFLNYQKQVGSPDCLKDLGMLSSSCEKTVIQLDFYENPTPKNLSQFLLEEEIVFLKEHSAYYKNYQDLYFEQLLRGLNMVDKQLILCCVVQGEIEKHPFHIRLETLFKDYAEKILVKVNTPEDLVTLDSAFFEKGGIVENKEIKLPQASRYLNLAIAKEFKKRKLESASSIEKLIHYPFEWVVNYILKLKPTQLESIPRDNQLKGNLAHKIVENLLNEAKHEGQYPINISDEKIETEFQKMIQHGGMYFLQEERRFELNLFKKQFVESFGNLISLINENWFTIVACEKPLSDESDCYIDSLEMHITGFIDLVLQDPQGKPFIIDMKWTHSDKKYKEKLTNEEAIQLSLYAVALKIYESKSCGYFLFNQNKFLSAVKLNGKNIELINCNFSNAIVLDKVNESLSIRWKEFNDGQIEIGDGFLLEDLTYHSSNGKIELPKDGKNKRNEAYSDLKLFKGQLN